jgi:hypothetical protein
MERYSPQVEVSMRRFFMGLIENDRGLSAVFEAFF